MKWTSTNRLIIGLAFLVGVSDAVAEAPANPTAIAARAWRQGNEWQILDEYREFLRIPNESTDKANVARNAQHLMRMMERRGLHPRLLEEPDAAPVVYGEWLAANATATYVFYAHYDGQPVEPKEWATPPFEPALRTARMDKGGEIIPPAERGRQVDPEWRIYARGASDDKAGVMALLSAVDALKASGIQPRANLKFVFEGEEEIGSLHLEKILASNKPLLEGDLWVICDGTIHASGRQSIVFGVRGIQPVEITVYGANRDLHSGQFGNWAPNPAMMLAQLLATMKDREGRVLIDGFYDGVIPLTETERKALGEVPNNDDELMRSLGLARVDGGGAKLVDLYYLPTLNIRGLSSGRVGGQVATIIPSTATAAFDIRLVKGITREQAVARLTAHVRKQGFFVTSTPPDEATRLKHDRVAQVVADSVGYEAARTSMDSAVAKKLVASVESVRGPLALLPTAGGSLPLDMIERALGSPTITVPIVNQDNNQHAKNENLRLQNFWDSIEMLAVVLSME